MLTLDHITIAALSLGEGVAFASAALGVSIPPGGAHVQMATHNHLVRLGDGLFLEIIAPDPSAAVAACIAGQGIFQSLAIGLEPYLARGELVQILPDWSDERFPLFAYHPSRHLPPAKVRAFLDFVIATVKSPA